MCLDNRATGVLRPRHRSAGPRPALPLLRGRLSAPHLHRTIAGCRPSAGASSTCCPTAAPTRWRRGWPPTPASPLSCTTSAARLGPPSRLTEHRSRCPGLSRRYRAGFLEEAALRRGGGGGHLKPAVVSLETDQRPAPLTIRSNGREGSWCACLPMWRGAGCGWPTGHRARPASRFLGTGEPPSMVTPRRAARASCRREKCSSRLSVDLARDGLTFPRT